MSDWGQWEAEIDRSPKDWLRPLISSGRTARVLELVEKDLSLLTLRFSGNRTPLMEAACNGQDDMAEKLLALGAKLDLWSAIALKRTSTAVTMLTDDPRLLFSFSPDRWPLLHFATAFGSSEMLLYLLSAGLDANDSRTMSRGTPIFAAGRSPFTHASILLEHGADIEARDKNGFTVLHYAARNGYLEWAQFLVACGARAGAQTNGRQTPWSLAVRHGQRELAAWLLTQ